MEENTKALIEGEQIKLAEMIRKERQLAEAAAAGFAAGYSIAQAQAAEQRPSLIAGQKGNP